MSTSIFLLLHFGLFLFIDKKSKVKFWRHGYRNLAPCCAKFINFIPVIWSRHRSMRKKQKNENYAHTFC